MFQGWQKCIRDHPLTPGGRGGNRGSLGVSKSNFIKSKSFANKSCQVCFKGDKNSFRVTFWPLGALGGAWGCQNQISSSQKVSVTKVVRYVSGVTKIHSVTFWPLGAQGHSGGGVPGGCQNQISSSQKVSLTKVVRYVSGVTKNHSGSPSDPWGSRRTWGGPWGGQKISSNQKISLSKVVRYVSGVTKTSQAPARLGPKQLCVST